MQFFGILKAVLITVACATYTSALDEKDTQVPILDVIIQANVPFNGAPAAGVTCVSRVFSQSQIELAGSDAATRERDGNKVPNPKNPGSNNPYPHQFRSQTFDWRDDRCKTGQPKGEVFEYPIFTSGLFDEKSKDVGNDRIFFWYVKGGTEAVFCGLGTHEGTGGKTFNFCTHH